MAIKQTRKSLIFLFTVSLLGFLCTFIYFLLAIFKNHAGFLTHNTDSYMCSAYLTYKLQNNRVSVFNVSFVGAVVATAMGLLVVSELLYPLVKLCHKVKGQWKVTHCKVVRLYIWYSLALIGLTIDTGYELSYVVEEGAYCLDYVEGDWVALMLFALFALACLFLCWLYLVCCSQSLVDAQPYQDQVSISYVPNHYRQTSANKVQYWKATEREYKRYATPQQSQAQEIEKRSSRYSSLKSQSQRYESRRSEANYDPEMDYQSYMAYLIQEMKHQKQEERKDQLQKPPIQEVSQDDRQSQKDQRQKLQLMSYSDFKRKTQQEKDNEKRLEREMMERSMLENIRRRQRQDLQSFSFSRQDPRLDQSLLDSEQKRGGYGEQLYFPANFVPKNEQERKQFEKYKKQLLKKQREGSSKLKHPQNVEGGRSKRSINKYLAENRRPNRNESTFLEALLQNNSRGSPTERGQLLYKEPQSFSGSEYSSKDNSNPSKKQQIQESPIIVEISPPPRPIEIEQVVERQNEPDQLHFHKEKTLDRPRKKLFGQTYDWSMDQALSILVKGVEEKSLKNRLRQIRDRRNSNATAYRGKKGQRLIESIRSTYD